MNRANQLHSGYINHFVLLLLVETLLINSWLVLAGVIMWEK
jgi:hypothetical protein